MRIRCPHCEQRVEVLEDDPLVEVDCPSCGSSFGLVGGSTESTVIHSSRSIGQFELVEELGRGAFGSVWKGHDTELDRFVAVKIPRNEQLNAEESEQFLREARSAAQLRHPNLVSVHEVGREESGQLYIVSDFIPGATLSDWSDTKLLGPRSVAELLITLCDAVQHAHDNGVIHRDLKPQNILMDADGVPHVTDFGLAKREVGEITMTVDGRILGTPAYMSPEQAAGKSHTVDGRSDIYSLGVIMFELLTGERPFRGSPQMLIHQILNDEPPGPRKLNHAVPRDLEIICLRCLENDIERRFQDCTEIANELRRFLNGEPIQSRPANLWERGRKWFRRNVYSIAAIAVIYPSLVGSLSALITAIIMNTHTSGPDGRMQNLVGAAIYVAVCTGIGAIGFRVGLSVLRGNIAGIRAAALLSALFFLGTVLAVITSIYNIQMQFARQGQSMDSLSVLSTRLIISISWLICFGIQLTAYRTNRAANRADLQTRDQQKARLQINPTE